MAFSKAGEPRAACRTINPLKRAEGGEAEKKKKNESVDGDWIQLRSIFTN
jgi:hypothetical protein